jgi:hypothetical protein
MSVELAFSYGIYMYLFTFIVLHLPYNVVSWKEFLILI